MKKVIFRLFLFLLPPALLLGAAEIFLRSQPNSYAVKQAAVDRMAPNVETLILGASHNYMGINPAFLKTCALNMAGVSQTFDVDINMLHSYMPLMPKLKTVVTGFDNAIFFDAPLLEGGENYRCTYYNLYMRMKRIDAWPRKAFEIADWNGASEHLKQILLNEGFAICDSLGWYTFDDDIFEKKGKRGDEAALRRNDNNTCRNWKNPVRNRGYLLEIASICRKSGIRLIILQTPLTKEYLKYIPERQAKMVEQMIDECRHLPGVTVRDYTRDPRFGDNDFTDVDHLSSKGAEKFSKILAEELGI